MSKYGSLVYQTKLNLSSKFHQGISKHEERHAGIDTRKYIYSFKTLFDYISIGCRFVKYCKKYGCRLLSDCIQYAYEWINNLIERNYSPRTISTYKSALKKLLGLKNEYLPKTPPMRRADIKKNRNYNYDSLSVCEIRHMVLVSFLIATGLRRKEVSMLRGTDLVKCGSKWFIHIVRGAKGGRERWVRIIGDDITIENCVSLMKEAGENRVFKSIPSGIKPHKYRAMNALNLYLILARPVSLIPKKDRYVCRRDMKGIILDKRAMALVSHQLGHNRIGVVAGNYFYNLKLEDLR